MPIGLTAHYKSAQFGDFTEQYIGKRKGLYVIVTRGKKGELQRTDFHNRAGHRVRTDFPSGNVRKYVPQFCGRVLGVCNAKITQTKGGDTSGIFNVRKTKRGYKYTSNWSHSTKATSYLFELGQFNLDKKLRTPNGSWKLIKISTP